MKITIALAATVAGLLTAMPSPMWAQDAHTTEADSRSQLEARKREQSAKFDAQEQACTGTFAVTDCVSAVNARRRAIMATLRKEENALNDAERRQRERERLQSLQQKAQQRAEQAPPDDVNAESTEERLRRQQDKLANHAPQSTPKTPAASKVLAPIDVQTRQQNATDYAARQRAASDRRAVRDKKLKEQGKTVVDLPTPP